jgi:hypothetical protein
MTVKVETFGVQLALQVIRGNVRLQDDGVGFVKFCGLNNSVENVGASTKSVHEHNRWALSEELDVELLVCDRDELGVGAGVESAKPG